MAYLHYNPNPVQANVADCSVRAVAAALNVSWENAYIRLTLNGIQMGDIIASDNVWGSVLRQNGFYKDIIPNTCPDCYTAEDFCKDNPEGIFVLGFGGHVATVVNGDLLDSWDSSKCVPIYYWYKGDGQNEQSVQRVRRADESAANTTK